MNGSVPLHCLDYKVHEITMVFPVAFRPDRAQGTGRELVGDILLRQFPGA